MPSIHGYYSVTLRRKRRRAGSGISQWPQKSYGLLEKAYLERVRWLKPAAPDRASEKEHLREISVRPLYQDRVSRSAKGVPTQDPDDVVPILEHRTRPGGHL